LTNRRVVAVHDHAVECGGNIMIPATLKVWAAGIKAPEFLRDLAGLETNRINQLVVGPTLQTSRDPNIFAFGDCASYTPTGAERAVPPRAQVANQQAILLAKAMHARLAGRDLPTFHFSDKGSLISLSNQNTVGSLMGNINVQGLLARLMYISLYRLHQVALHGFFKTGVLMSKDLLSRSSGPTLKLH
jgi:NADH dehydrogenase